jgi:hypothetical protein
VLDSSLMDWHTLWTAAVTALISSAVLTALLNVAFFRYTEGLKASFAGSVEALKAVYAGQLAADQSRRSSEAARVEAHYDAVNRHADRVSEVFQDLDAIRSVVLGDDASYFDVEARHIGSERDVAAHVAANLRVVWTSHPTAAVRLAARQLYDDVKGFYGDPPPDSRKWPSSRDDDALHAHATAAERLIELLHTPPPP